MEQKLKFKCPHCGWIRTIDVQAYLDTGAASVTRGVGDELTKAVEKLKNLLSTETIDAASAVIDLPECPHCGQGYRYNVRTREVLP